MSVFGNLPSIRMGLPEMKKEYFTKLDRQHNRWILVCHRTPILVLGPWIGHRQPQLLRLRLSIKSWLATTQSHSTRRSRPLFHHPR